MFDGRRRHEGRGKGDREKLRQLISFSLSPPSSDGDGSPGEGGPLIRAKKGFFGAD